MLPGLSNVPAPDTTIESSGIAFLADIAIASCVYKDMEISKKTQGSQTQHLPNDTVVDCSSNTKNKKISDFSIKTTNASETGIANTDQKPYQCNQCGKVFQLSRALQQHTRNVHKTGGREKCPDCEKTFKNKRTLGIHRRDKHGDNTKQYGCKQCNKVFDSTASLSRHTNTVHVTRPPRKCPDCEKSFKLKRSLNEHRKAEHSGSEKPYKCNHCDKTFSYQSHWKRHEDTHTDKHDHKCPVCLNSYSRAVELNRHITVKHANQNRKFICTECGSSYLHENSLRRHQQTHVARIYLECPLCNKKLCSRSSLTRHHKIVHNMDDLRYKRCSETLASKK